MPLPSTQPSQPQPANQTNNYLHQVNNQVYNQLLCNQPWFDPGHYQPNQVYDQANQANNHCSKPAKLCQQQAQPEQLGPGPLPTQPGHYHRQ